MNTFYNIDSVENVVVLLYILYIHIYIFTVYNIIYIPYIVRFEIEFKKVHYSSRRYPCCLHMTHSRTMCTTFGT